MKVIKLLEKKTLTLRQAKYFWVNKKHLPGIKINRTSAKFKIVFQNVVGCFPLMLIRLPLCSVTLPFLTPKERAFFSAPWINPGLVTCLGQENVAEVMFASSRANFHTCEWGHLEPSSPVTPPFESSLMNNPRPKRRCLDKPCNCEKE